MTRLVLIFLAAGLGGVLRYAISGWVHASASPSFPLGTLIVNVAGCLAIGFLSTALAGPVLIREEYRIALLVGLIGGFTTFSTFGHETFDLIARRQWLLATANIALGVAMGLVAVWIGARLARRVFGV